MPARIPVPSLGLDVDGRVRGTLHYSRWLRRKPVPCRPAGKRTTGWEIDSIQAEVDVQGRLAGEPITLIVRGLDFSTREYHPVLPEGVAESWQRWLDRHWIAAMRKTVDAWLSEPDEDDDEADLRALQVAERLFKLPEDQVRPAALLADGFVGTAEQFLATWEGIRAARPR